MAKETSFRPSAIRKRYQQEKGKTAMSLPLF